VRHAALHRRSALALVSNRAETRRDGRRAGRGLAQAGLQARLELPEPVQRGGLTGEQRAPRRVGETRAHGGRAVAPEPREKLLEPARDAGDDRTESAANRALARV